MTDPPKQLVGTVWRQGVLQEIHEHVFSSPDAEVGGFLIGEVGDDARLRVAEARPARAARRTATSVTFTHEDWADALGHVETLERAYRIVGWYHSHPGYGIFLSGFDLFIHQNFFAHAGQVAHVVDPLGGREGLFGWRGGEVVKFAEQATERPPLRPR